MEAEGLERETKVGGSHVRCIRKEGPLFVQFCTRTARDFRNLGGYCIALLGAAMKDVYRYISTGARTNHWVIWIASSLDADAGTLHHVPSL